MERPDTKVTTLAVCCSSRFTTLQQQVHNTAAANCSYFSLKNQLKQQFAHAACTFTEKLNIIRHIQGCRDLNAQQGRWSPLKWGGRPEWLTTLCMPAIPQIVGSAPHLPAFQHCNKVINVELLMVDFLEPLVGLCFDVWGIGIVGALHLQVLQLWVGHARLAPETFQVFQKLWRQCSGMNLLSQTQHCDEQVCAQRLCSMLHALGGSMLFTRTAEVIEGNAWRTCDVSIL